MAELMAYHLVRPTILVHNPMIDDMRWAVNNLPRLVELTFHLTLRARLIAIEAMSQETLRCVSSTSYV